MADQALLVTLRKQDVPADIVRQLQVSIRVGKTKAEAIFAAWVLSSTSAADVQLTVAEQRTNVQVSSLSTLQFPSDSPDNPQLQLAAGGIRLSGSVGAGIAAEPARYGSFPKMTVRQRRSEEDRHYRLQRRGVEAGGWTPLQAGCNMLLGETAFWACVQHDLLQRQPAHIVLRSLGLAALPPWFGDLPFAVESLDLADNALAVFPPEIARLLYLQILVLDSNKLRSIPSSINRLAGTIQEIGLGYNELEELPVALGDLRQLRYLDVMFNRLRELPASLKNLTMLQELLADNNELSQLPEACLDMTSLIRIRLDYNKCMQVYIFYSLPRNI